VCERERERGQEFVGVIIITGKQKLGEFEQLSSVGETSLLVKQPCCILKNRSSAAAAT